MKITHIFLINNIFCSPLSKYKTRITHISQRKIPLHILRSHHNKADFRVPALSKCLPSPRTLSRNAYKTVLETECLH